MHIFGAQSGVYKQAEKGVVFALCLRHKTPKAMRVIFDVVLIDVPMLSPIQEETMKEQTFTLILTTDPNDDEADRLYGIIADGTLSTIAGVPQINFHRQATHLESAIRSAMQDVRSSGLDILRVEIEPESMLQQI